MAKPPDKLTLTQVNAVGRQAVKVGAIFIVVLIVGRFALETFVSVWKSLNPPPPPPPTVGFGLLPQLAFPDLDTQTPAEYQLQTPNGGFPRFPDRAKVYFMPQKNVSLLDDENARSLAAGYGFVFDPELITDTTYRWRKSEPLESILEMNINTNSFTIETDYLQRPELLLQSDLPDSTGAVSLVKNFLSTADLLDRDIATVSGDVAFYKAVGGEYQPAVSRSDADVIFVNLFRTPIDGLPSYTPDGRRGTVQAVVSGNFSQRESIVSFKHFHHDVDYSQVHTYPLRSPQSAWELLQSGGGYVVPNQAAELDSVVIRSISLGYYDSIESQQYLQPIYVFTGDNGFLAYVSALDPQVVASTLPTLK